jgi:hypothetical protein
VSTPGKGIEILTIRKHEVHRLHRLSPVYAAGLDSTALVLLPTWSRLRQTTGARHLFRFLLPDGIDLSMRNSAVGTIERLLTTELSDAAVEDTSTSLASLGAIPASERVAALYRVLGHNSDVAWQTASLPLLDELRLSLELVRAGRRTLPQPHVVPPASTVTRCRARHRGRPRVRGSR